MKRTLLFALVCISLSSCFKRSYFPEGDFNAETQTAPDYSQLTYWAAHPDKTDEADRTPDKSIPDLQAEAEADVFFVHPTIYVGTEKGDDQWNAPVNDSKFNERVDESTILNQASIFNGAGRVFAPRYRQAHLDAYFTVDKENAKKAFALAYSDVRKAFKYYLEHHNNGRPIIIASHSQGTTHCGPLMKEFFDGKPLMKQLVAAYVVGIEVPGDYFESIPPCEKPEQTGCFCGWRTWERGYYPRNHNMDNNYVVTNPLNWKTDTTYATQTMNKGTILYRFKKPKKEMVDAQVSAGVLWVNKPKFFGSRFIKMQNYHIADYNLFYINVRENAILRVKAFLAKQREASGE